MLQIVNSEELARQVVLVSYVESLAARLCRQESEAFGELSVKAVQLERCPAVAAPGWISFSDDAGTGVGICPREVVSGRTRLRSRIAYAHYAARLAALLISEQGEHRYSVQQVDQEYCPEPWKGYRVRVGDDELLCAVSFPPPPLGVETQTITKTPRVVRLRMRGWCACDGALVGVLGEYDDIGIEIEGSSETYKLCIRQGRVMVVANVENVPIMEENEALAVRLDLGEIEIGLQELLALRAGSAIELATEVPLQCFLRIGATTLATGEIALYDEKLSIRITEVACGD